MYPNGLFSWADVSSPEPAASSAFYSSLFGWAADDQYDPDGNYVYTMLLSDGVAVAGLGAQPPELAQAGVPPNWISYVSVEDLDATLELIVANGGSVVMGPIDVFNSGRMAIASDPLGAVFAMWQAVDHVGAGVFNVPGSMTWNELVTSDVNAAKTFYGAVFGWTFQDFGDNPMEYWVIMLDGKGSGGVFSEDPSNGGMMARPSEMAEQIPDHWMVYFCVSDTDESMTRAKELGAGTIMDPFDTPAGRIAILTDPSGARFSIIAAATAPG